MAKLLVAVFVFVCCCPAATVLSLGPPSWTPGVGDQFIVTVEVGDVSDLYSAQFSVGFDPAKLEFMQITEGPFLSSSGEATVFDPGIVGLGGIENTAVRIAGADPGVSGSGVLAELVFMALVAGQTELSLYGDVLLDSANSGIAASPQGLTLEIEEFRSPPPAVPEPGSFLLMAGLAAVLRRRRS